MNHPGQFSARTTSCLLSIFNTQQHSWVYCPSVLDDNPHLPDAYRRNFEVLRHTEGECAVNQRVSGAIQVPGFGASDCRAACVSHLKRVR